MSVAREQKEQKVKELHDDLSSVAHAILVDFRGLDVAGATELRRRLHDLDATFRVVKNTVALRAVEDLALADVSEAFEGQTAIAYTDDDIVSLAKTLRDFAKDHETPQFKAGVVDGKPISLDEFETIADLPSREDLIGKALYLMQYPITGFVTALSGILRGIVVALDQIRQKKESGELPAGLPAEAAETEAAKAAVAEAEGTEAEAAEAEGAAEAEAAEAGGAEAEASETEPATAEGAEAEASEAEAAEAEGAEAEASKAEAAAAEGEAAAPAETAAEEPPGKEAAPAEAAAAEEPEEGSDDGEPAPEGDGPEDAEETEKKGSTD